MDERVKAAAAWAFAEAAHGTTYGNWILYWDELPPAFDGIDHDELFDALMDVGDPWLLEVEFTDDGIDLTVSDFYTVDADEDDPGYEAAWLCAERCRALGKSIAS